MVHDKPETAQAAEEELTLDQFHHCMGHILVGVACCLVETDFVTGVSLELTPS